MVTRPTCPLITSNRGPLLPPGPPVQMKVIQSLELEAPFISRSVLVWGPVIMKSCFYKEKRYPTSPRLIDDHPHTVQSVSRPRSTISLIPQPPEGGSWGHGGRMPSQGTEDKGQTRRSGRSQMRGPSPYQMGRRKALSLREAARALKGGPGEPGSREKAFLKDREPQRQDGLRMSPCRETQVKGQQVTDQHRPLHSACQIQ